MNYDAEDYRWDEELSRGYEESSMPPQTDIENGQLYRSAFSSFVWKGLCEAFGEDENEKAISFDPDTYDIDSLIADIEGDERLAAMREEEELYEEEELKYDRYGNPI